MPDLHPDPPQVSDAEKIARLFHEAYEELAPTHNWSTQPGSRKPWEEVPEANRALMIATVERILPHLHPERGEEGRLREALEEAEDRFEFCENCERPAREEDLKVEWCRDAESGEQVDLRLCSICRVEGLLRALAKGPSRKPVSFDTALALLAQAEGIADDALALLNQDTEERDRA